MLQAGSAAALVPAVDVYPPSQQRENTPFLAAEFRVHSLSSADAFDRFGPELNQLATTRSDFAALEHRIGLWSIAKGWRSRVFVVCKGEKLKAAILLRERRLLGISTGYFLGGDDLGDICLLCEPAQRRHILRWFLQWILQRRAFVVHLQSGESHSLSIRSTDLWSGCSVHKTRLTSRWRHELAATFDDSVAALGKRTRRNLRHSLRLALQNDWRFVPSLTEQEIQESIQLVDEHATYPASLDVLEARAKLRSQLFGFFSAGVRDAHGNWLSTISGTRSAAGVTRVLWQHNSICPGVSLCTVMRALLIDAEVKNKSRRIEYYSGTNSLMEHYCLPENSTRTIFVKRGLRFKIFRLLLRLPVASPHNVLRTEMLAGEI